MRPAIQTIASLALTALLAGTAQAEILIKVDKSTQHMTVVRDGAVLYNWSVSTGRRGYATPSGAYTTFRMEADHYSKEWDDAPMPHSIFFTKTGHAIHGSYETKKLGVPVSHGCVRISPAHAATLFELVKSDGLANTKVVLTGSEQIALMRRGTQEPRGTRPLNLDPRFENGYARRYVTPADEPRTAEVQPFYLNRNSEYRTRDYVQPYVAYPRDWSTPRSLYGIRRYEPLVPRGYDPDE